MKLRDQIRQRLAEFEQRRLTTGFSREAAVLLLVFELEGQPHLLLTRRTQDVRTHKGQISFPGGMRLDGESLDRTALRETFEEVGISETQIELLGRFHDYVSSSEYLVVPFVGFIQDVFTTEPQAREVAEILQVPFQVFTDPARMRVESMLRSGKLMDIYFYSFAPHEIWGLTARIIKDFLEMLRYPDPAAVIHS
jgi:8-oxo-dGTP pyrophosphatase MutT (NUDIX family)